MKKVITNQTKKEELAAAIAAVEPPVTPPVVQTPAPVVEPPVVTAPVTPEPVAPAVEEEFDIEVLTEKKKEELKPEELAFLEAHQDNLDDEQKIQYGFVQPPVVAPPVTPEPAPPVPASKETDWQARYAGSTRESQVLAEAKRTLIDAIDKAGELPAPTEEEMKKLHGDDWDMLDDTQKEVAKAKEHAQRKLQKINEAREAFKKSDEFVEKAKAFSTDPETIKKCPKLEGHEQEFVQYCSTPSHIGVDLEVLYRAFTTELPAPAVPQRKTLLESGSGGGTPPTKPTGFTTEQITFMRTHEPRKYAQMVKEKKIKIEL